MMHSALWLLALLPQSTPTPIVPESPQGSDSIQTFPTVVVEPAPSNASGPPPDATTRITIGADEVFEHNYRTLPEALRDVPQVMVQETSYGQGSPYLRGFTGFGTVLLVDGVRLNNSVFRAGPNQYWNTVDITSLDRLEVELGPNSPLYGSDALGGVVRAFTRSPYGELNTPTGKLIYRYSQAADYHIFRAEGSFVGERTGVLVGLTAKDFGDIEGGSEVGLQPGTGYDESDADIKVEHWLDDHSLLTLGHYQVHQNDVPRTHSTVDGIDWRGLTRGSDLVRSLDQDRTLTYVQLHQSDLDGLFDAMTTSLSWQTQKEERYRVRSNGRIERQGFDVGTVELFHHMFREGPSGHWTYGLEFVRDGVDSFLDKGSFQTAADDIQGPVADDARYTSIGAFVQDRFAIQERTDLIAAARFSNIVADADSVRDPVLDTQTSVHDTYHNNSFSLELEHRLTEWQDSVWYGGVSQGFRAPNLSDLSRFDNARTNEFEVPAFGLEEETVTGYEMGLRSETGRTRYDISAFYTDITDGIVRVPTGNVNGSGESEITKANVGDGYVWGWAGSLTYALNESFDVHLDAAYQRGEQDTFPTSAPVLVREPIDRLMPTTLHAGVRWNAPVRNGWVELRLTHAQKADRLSTRDEQDTSRIPPGGTPAYSLLDLRGGWKLSSHAECMVGLENLFDEDYRVHGSGVNGPGRGVVLGLIFSF
ncbi:MAG: TonB-dependent receptor [Planctomycetes bacterium]|nr:TonB-dependent receptor [Planctomycetota bacterium]MCB9909006.1 TonB-dependent receptor [Planctomycetota bacterium]MCB9911749.1 TonB-dependent receptor [Planctomycetota bacterium]HPF13107.1 TonB-dependent receptor [Planctomycetota bacterium]